MSDAKRRTPLKRKLLIIGVGAGNPDHVTVQAIEAMNRADVFFIPDKGEEKAELARFRHALIVRYVRAATFRKVGYRVPTRRSGGDSYEGRVADWHTEIARTYREMLLTELAESQTGAFLVWGDPTLYDSTLRILERVQAGGDIELDCEVIPGISSLQALAARHRVALNAIGRAVMITNGRGLGKRLPENVESVAVLLNAEKALRQADGELDAYWGAYVGMAEEILVSGQLKDIAGDVERRRALARKENGWIMDCLILKEPNERRATRPRLQGKRGAGAPHSPSPRARKRRT
jgi:precorrin-6A synthase